MISLTYNNSPSNGDDRITAMTTDSAGNVYVAGFVRQVRPPCGADYDYAVIKYTSAGVPAWAAPRIYNGPASGEDKPTGIAVGKCRPGFPDLCVYVTGASAGSGSDYATIKLNASDGTYSSTWPNVGDGAGVRRYSTGVLANGDRANAIAVDQDGNAYVTGRVEGPKGYGIGTVKYDSTGAIPDGWPRLYQAFIDPELCRYAEGNSIALDETNYPQVYAVVAGTSSSSSGGGQYDYAIVKYRGGDGNQEWANSVDVGTGDVATKVVVDGGGNIFVTGQVGDQDLFQLDCAISCLRSPASLETQGIHSALGPGGPTNLDYGTIGYLPSGAIGRPLIRYNGMLEGGQEATDERALDLVVDGNGDVIVTGYSGISGDHDWATVKYRRSPWGQAWAQRVFSTDVGRPQDVAFALTVDGLNNVYVTGGFEGSGSLDTATFRRARTRQYNSAGATVGTYDYTGSTVDNLTRTISLAPGGRIVVAGHTFNSGTGNDFLTIALDPPW